MNFDMTHYIDADLLRAEIERLEGENNCGTSDFIEAKRIAYNQVKKVLDTLPEQPVEGLEELRKEVIKFSQDHFDELHSDIETIDIVHIIASHFAEWGRKQVLQEIYQGKIKPVDKITAAWLDDE